MKKDEKINDEWDVLDYDLEEFIEYTGHIDSIDKQFIMKFLSDYNLDGENEIIEIKTNNTEMSYFIHKIISNYKTHLISQGLYHP